MEARKITVVSTKTQTKYVIMSAATTLAELKRDLTANNIDYNGMTFYEGVSRIELKSDDSILPHDIPYKGNITNELVFQLTVPKEKISSGVDRRELYKILSDNNWSKECSDYFGKTFTRVKSEDIAAFINSKKTRCSCVTNCTEEDMQVRQAVAYLAEILHNNHVISALQKAAVIEHFKYVGDNDILESSYSDEDITEMFDSMIN